MKHILQKIALTAAAAAIALTLCACGSDLDGTWTSASNSQTHIRFSGSKVRVTYGNFKISGTWQYDEDDNIVFDLTDENGDKYKIIARISEQNDKRLILTNSNGDQEVFEK